MPYLCALFDDATQAVIAEAADRFAASSPFKRDAKGSSFHIPLIGGLHVYTREEISAAVQAGSQAANQPIEGHFVRWEASARGRLRVVVALDNHDGLVRVSSCLPRGKEWRNELFVDVGSLADVDESDRAAFVEAAATAFPITESSKFVCPSLDYVDCIPKKAPVPRPKPLNPNAAVFHPSVKIKLQKPTKKKPPAASAHRKWVRPGAPAAKAAAPMEWAETGPTGRQPAIRKKQLQRPAASNGPLARR